MIGKIETGNVRVGDHVVCQPGKAHLKVKTIQINNNSVEEGETGRITGLEFHRHSGDELKRGCILG